MSSQLLRKVTIFNAAVFSFVAIVAPVSTFAQSNPGGPAAPSSGELDPKKIKLGGPTKCPAVLKAYPLEKVRKFGEDRVKIRETALEKLKKKNAATKDTSAARYQRVVQKNADKKLQRAADAASKKKGVRIAAPTIKPANIDNLTEKIDADIKATSELVAKSKKDLAAAKTSEEAANSICNLIYEGRVFGYMQSKVNEQRAAAHLRNLNAANDYKYQTIVEEVRIREIPASQIDPAKLPNPSPLFAEIDALQKSLEKIDRKNPKYYSEFKAFEAKRKDLRKKIAEQAKVIDAAEAKLKTLRTEPQKPANNGGSTTQGGDNTGGALAPSPAPSPTTPPPSGSQDRTTPGDPAQDDPRSN